MFSLIVTYGKCFVSAEGRRLKLEIDALKQYLTSEDIKVHHDLMSLRHTYVAHAGMGNAENSGIWVAVERKKILVIEQIKLSTVSIDNDSLRKYTHLVETLSSVVKKQFAESWGRVLQELTDAGFVLPAGVYNAQE